MGTSQRQPGEILWGIGVADHISLTLPQFRKRLLRVSQSMPIGMTAVTVPTLRKRKNPWAGRVMKISRVNGFINWRYTSAVNRQRTREHRKADFQAVERCWGTRLRDTPLIEYGDELYLDVKVQARQVIYTDTETLTEIPWPDIKPFVPPIKKARRQRLNRDVILRDFNIENIAELRINGEVWRIRKCWNRLHKLRPAA